MKRAGSLILSSPRTGSTWLASMINSTGQMGRCDEWLQKSHFPSEFSTLNDEFYERLLNLSSTPNGRFCIKIFPWHLYRISTDSGIEFIQHISERYDVKIILLERRDKISQAISHAKARKSGMWTSDQAQKYDVNYNFERIFRSYLNINQQDMFWKTYLDFKDIQFKHVYYEDVLESENEFISELANELDVSPPEEISSTVNKQRNKLNDEWTERFLIDMKQKNLLAIQSSRKLPSRSLKNIWRFINKQPVSDWTTWHASNAFDHM